MAARSHRMSRLRPSQLKAAIPKSWIVGRKSDEKLFQMQHRALAAMSFSAQVEHEGFNLYVMGRPGFGQHEAVSELLGKVASEKTSPPDWIYVYNFQAPDKPLAIEMPNGSAHAFRKAMEELIDDLANSIPAVFESDDYQSKRQLMEDEFANGQEQAFNEIVKSTHEKNLVLLHTPMGFAIVASRDGKALKPEEFAKLGKDEQEEINRLIGEQQLQLEEFLKRVPKREKEHRNRVEALNAEMATNSVDGAIQELTAEFGQIGQVKQYLEAVRRDMIENADIFLDGGGQVQVGTFPVAKSKHYKKPQFQRYRINVLVGAGADDAQGAAVRTVALPTFSNLMGRIEHGQEMGALITDFTMIKAGELHKANGGYLIIDALQILREPLAWDALKRALRTKEISISSVSERLSLMTTISLEPVPVPLSLRVVLLGDRQIYQMLSTYDPDFAGLFKVVADLEDEILISRQNTADLSSNIDAIAKTLNLKPLKSDGLLSILSEASRIADDAEKFSLDREQISDVMIEADYWAGKDNKEKIGALEVDKAIAQIESRSDRVRALNHEAIGRNTLLIDTEGEKVGQINGLTVMQLGKVRFGKPARITAQTRMGKGRVIDIEREVELGGPIHSKGVLILSSYLAANYARNVPLSLWASIVLEQSYGAVDGDSASAAELIALLSSLAELPVTQSYAITGSINQNGEIQAIGGVNEKIEGFFDICRERGLSGKQGVIIPSSNVKNLALRKRVIDAVSDGSFSIHSVSSIDQAAQFLMGTPFGKRGKKGQFPAGSINALVEAKLISFAMKQREFLKDSPVTRNAD